ncbi:hypothetical protein [Actinomadura parmotrematis]|uniref:DUF4261 domain-containing protein n=1 Tax=Actinomadura parmotrematis TaxID=2864039 RepID=A0ABS7FT27_9ACTN|nr:hypothetical protein [Actinomadura parmotrematis]MBW8483553.1 hypothetical protein [Actinomadura parmotrematis]
MGNGDDGAAGHYGRVPARVLLRGEPGGWHYEVIDEKDGRERVRVPGAGVRWDAAGRADPEPSWWPRRLAETAAAARELAERAVTDRTFDELGVEAAISWFAVAEPVEWEGLVTLRDPDPARFPGRVAPFVVVLEPGRGAVLPDAHLLFSTPAADVRSVLDSVARRCGVEGPAASFLCGYTDHQSVRVGRGSLSAASARGPDGVPRVAWIYGQRADGWSGNPELRLRLDGVDLLDEPAADVVTLFRDLGHEVLQNGYRALLPALGLRLYAPGGGRSPGRFTGAALQFPAPPGVDGP